MQARILSVLLLLLIPGLFFSAAMAAESEKNEKNEKNEQYMQHYGRMPHHQAQRDGKILSWLIVLNKNEIAAGREVLNRRANPAVMRYAHLMVRQHSQNLNETLRITHRLDLMPIPSHASMELKEDGRKDLHKLRSLRGQAFQEAYINAMIKGHSDALSAIQQYIKMVRNPLLRHHLIATERHVEMHLEKAKEIQSHMRS